MSSVVEIDRYEDRELVTDGGHSVDGTDRILDVVSEEIGVCVLDEWTMSHQFIFRGPHGRLESIKYSDNLGHWKRGPYCIEETLRKRLEKAINGHTQWSGWRHVRRSAIGEEKPTVVDGVSESVRCTLCHERFPSGNAFGWHLADVHEVDTDEKEDYYTTVPEGQRTLDRFARADGGRTQSTETEQ